MKQQKRRVPDRVALPLFLLLGLLPPAAGLLYALAYSTGTVGVLSQGMTAAHWSAVLSAPETWISLALSAGLAVVVTLVSAFLALALVLYDGEAFERGAGAYSAYFPLAIPPLAAAFLGFQWLGQSGMIARLLTAAGLIPGLEQAPEWINDSWHIGVLLVLTGMTAPYFLLLLLEYRRSENLPELMRLARTLGASNALIIRRVAIPVLLRRALPNMALSAVFLFGAYEVPLLLGRQSPRMISVLIAQKFRKFNLDELPQAYALTILYALVVAVAGLLVYRLLMKTQESAQNSGT